MVKKIFYRTFVPMKIEIHLKEQSQPIILEEVKNTYQKGDLFCVYLGDRVYKFPLKDIFRIKEDYKTI